jgi:pimeloyl-ACP methyl ester carboxylesterase
MDFRTKTFFVPRERQSYEEVFSKLREVEEMMKRTSLWVVAAIIVCTAASATVAQAIPTTGGWIGWAYVGEGGDLPLRVWLSEGPDGLSARFDGVPWRAPGWPAELRVEGDRAVLSLSTPKGTPIRLEGSFEGGRWHGEARISDYEGEFELLHAPGLADVNPDAYADVAGYYRMSDGDVLEARALSWGEVVVRSIRTGEQRTLLPTGRDRFMTGPARYVPTPVEFRYEVIRSPEGAVIQLVRTDADGNIIHGEPFALRTEELDFESGGVKLAGTVTRPDDDRPRSGVVVLGGSSWETRATHDFQVRSLAALGFTVIHWDKRGFGESGGTDPVPFSTTATDAIAAAGRLRRRSDVTGVGYFGVSRGGWTAPLAVSNDPDAAFLMLLVPPAASPAVQEQGARLARMCEEGYSSPEVELAERTLEAAWRFVETGNDADWESYYALRQEASRKGVPDDVLPPRDPDPNEWQWSRMNMLFDPQPVLRQVHVPVLAVFAEDDHDVLTDVHRPLMREAFAAAGNDDVTLVTVLDVPHSLARPWGTPLHRTTGIGPEGFDVVMRWSREHRLIR